MMPGHDAAEPTEAATHAFPLRVRYAECDQQKVVFNAHFLAYFDIGFTELFRAAFGSPQPMLDTGVDFVVAEAALRYHLPAHFDDQLTVQTGITRMGTTSLTTRYRILRDRDLLVDGTLRHVLVNLTRLEARDASPTSTIPDWVRNGLSPWTREQTAP